MDIENKITQRIITKISSSKLHQPIIENVCAKYHSGSRIPLKKHKISKANGGLQKVQKFIFKIKSKIG